MDRVVLAAQVSKVGHGVTRPWLRRGTLNVTGKSSMPSTGSFVDSIDAEDVEHALEVVKEDGV
jgi:hypothetical protein